MAKQKKTRPAKSKAEPTPSVPPPAPLPPLEETVHSARAELLTGLTDRRLRQLAVEGFFPEPDNGHYQTLALLAGVIRFYRTSSAAESIQKKKSALLDLKIEDTKIDIDAKKNELKPIGFFAKQIFALGEEIKATLNFQLNDRLPALNAGLPAAKQRVNNREVFLAICARQQEFAKKWTL